MLWRKGLATQFINLPRRIKVPDTHGVTPRPVYTTSVAAGAAAEGAAQPKQHLRVQRSPKDRAAAAARLCRKVGEHIGTTAQGRLELTLLNLPTGLPKAVARNVPTAVLGRSR